MKKHARRYDSVIRTPFATLGLVFDGDVLHRVDYLKSDTPQIKPRSSVSKAVCQQIEYYCENGQSKQLFEIDYEAIGTPFQQKVWRAIDKIPYGKTRTYGDIAKQLKTSPRAVGNACRLNPLVLVVPCHRVVSASGIGGYSGSSSGQMIKIKQWLLTHEKRQ